MEPYVSIIVPVYNAEATLRRCVESVLNQEYADFQLILTDDGSTDGSGGGNYVVLSCGLLCSVYDILYIILLYKRIQLERQ